LGDNQGRGTTWAGLRNKWHLGYSNIVIISNIFIIVNIFDEKQNILIIIKYICLAPEEQLGAFPVIWQQSMISLSTI